MTESRPILISQDMADAIEHGARLLTTLAAVERAHMLGDEDDLASILDGVDPIEVQLTAATLHQLGFLWQLLKARGGSTLAPDGSAPSLAREAPSGPDADPPLRPSAPTILPCS